MTHDTFIKGPTDARTRHDENEERILAAALAEVREHGYRGNSWSRIARACSLTDAELSRRYPDERVLLIETLRYRDRAGIDMLLGNPGDGRALLQSFVSIASYAAEAPGSVELFATLSTASTAPDHPGHEYFRERYAWLRDLLVDALRELEEEGELRRRCDPQATAAQAIALLDGLQVQWLLDRDAVDLEALVRCFFDAYLHRPLEPGKPAVLPARP